MFRDVLRHSRFKSTASLLLILAVGLALSLFSLALTPPWQVPDEPQHFQMARLLADLGRWPTLTDVWSATGVRDQVYESLVRHRFWEIRAHRAPAPSLWEGTAPDVLLPPIYAPPAYYGLAAGALRILGDSSLNARLLVLRLLSALAGLAELYFVFRMSLLVFSSQPALALAATALVAFFPMRAYMTGASPDPLASMVSAAALWAMLAWLRRPLTPARGAAVGLLVAAALLTKRTTAFLLPVVVVFVILNGRSNPRISRMNANEGEKENLRSFWIGLGAVVVCLFVPLALWAWTRPALLQPGEAWPYPGGSPTGLFSARPEWLARLFSAEAWTWVALREYALCLGIAFASFWGNFGWLTIPLELEWYAALAVLTGLAAIGLVRAGWKQRGHLRPEAALAAWAVGLTLLQLVAAMVTQGVPQQGRYLFPALGLIACGLVRGWSEWRPKRARRMLPHAVSIGMLVLFAVAWGRYILPAFGG